jgi:hypothetical protein
MAAVLGAPSPEAWQVRPNRMAPMNYGNRCLFYDAMPKPIGTLRISRVGAFPARAQCDTRARAVQHKPA